mmetsp:Transcript_93319/g.263415  ORF Transcript_93319/g.263415 Transcript_93319/m.263415 type:complete len:234 (+) Transcript_93319:2022-2723(+)
MPPQRASCSTGLRARGPARVRELRRSRRAHPPGGRPRAPPAVRGAFGTGLRARGPGRAGARRGVGGAQPPGGAPARDQATDRALAELHPRGRERGGPQRQAVPGIRGAAPKCGGDQPDIAGGREGGGNRLSRLEGRREGAQAAGREAAEGHRVRARRGVVDRGEREGGVDGCHARGDRAGSQQHDEIERKTDQGLEESSQHVGERLVDRGQRPRLAQGGNRRAHCGAGILAEG